MENVMMLNLLYGAELVKCWMVDFMTPQPFGEDGGMAISARYSQKDAWKKIVKYEQEEWGLTAEEVMPSWKNLEISYLVAPLPKEKQEEDWTWVISRVKESKLKVWAYWA